MELSSCDWKQIAIVFSLMMWEAFLGKSKRIKPNSTIQLIAMGAMSMVMAFIRWRKKK